MAFFPSPSTSHEATRRPSMARARRVDGFATAHDPLALMMRRLTCWLDERAMSRTILVTGAEGAGKSALIDHAFERREHMGQAWVRAAPGAFCTGRKLHAFLKEQRSVDLVLEDIDELPRSVQVNLAEQLATRQAFTVLTGRLESDEGIGALGLAPALQTLVEGAHLHVPCLAQRPEDVLFLAVNFLSEGMSFDAGAGSTLRSHAWRENVRELRATILGAARLAQRQCSTVITRDHVEMVLNCPTPVAAPVHVAMLAESFSTHEALENLSLRSATRLMEAAIIVRALKAADGNVALAGRRLQTPHSTLKSRIDALSSEVNSVVNWVG